MTRMALPLFPHKAFASCLLFQHAFFPCELFEVTNRSCDLFRHFDLTIVVQAFCPCSFASPQPLESFGQSLSRRPALHHLPHASRGVSILSTMPVASAKTTPTTPSSFDFPHQSQWSPGDISNVLFGCIATIVGVITLLLMLWLGRRRFGSASTGNSSAPPSDKSTYLTPWRTRCAVGHRTHEASSRSGPTAARYHTK